jgi:sugar/nucleoside kinase (ribokinase family)
MTAYLDGRDLRECGIMGSMASRHCLQTPGASTWRATADELAKEAVELGYPMRGF